MREYRAGKRRSPLPGAQWSTPSREEIEAVKQSLRSAERLRAIGVKLK